MRFSFQQPFVGGGVLRDATKNGCVGDYVPTYLVIPRALNEFVLFDVAILWITE